MTEIAAEALHIWPLCELNFLETDFCCGAIPEMSENFSLSISFI